MEIHIRGGPQEFVLLSRPELDPLGAGGSEPAAVDAFEELMRAKSAGYRCYRAWEIESVSVSDDDKTEPRTVSFRGLGERLLAHIRGEAVYMVVHVAMREPRGFNSILSGLCYPPLPLLPAAEALEVCVVLPSRLQTVAVTLHRPVSWEQLYARTVAALGPALGDAPFTLICRGRPLSPGCDLSSPAALAAGEVLFYQVADSGPVRVGVFGCYREFLDLQQEGARGASLLGAKARVLRQFGVKAVEERVSRCVLRSAATHGEITSLSALEPVMDLSVPEALLLHAVVYSDPSGSCGWEQPSPASTPSSSLSPLASADVVVDGPPGAEPVLLLHEWSWAECHRTLGRRLFGDKDHLFDVLDGVDIVSDVQHLLHGTRVVVRPFSGMTTYRCFNYSVGDRRAKAGPALPVSAFPLPAATLFEQARALWAVPPNCTFQLFVHSAAKSGRTALVEGSVINAPKAGRVAKVSLEPTDFVVVSMDIAAASYALLDDLLAGVSRARRSVSLSLAALRDPVDCRRDISRAFGLPSSVSVEELQAAGGETIPLARATTAIYLEPMRAYTLILRQAAPVELTALSLQSGVAEVTLQQLWSEHCSLEEIAWVLEHCGQSLTVERAQERILKRRERRIPNDILLCVECLATAEDRNFSINPEEIIRHIRSSCDVSIREAPGGCPEGAARWFFECATPETATMLYHSPPAEIGANVAIFLAPHPDDALYDCRPRAQSRPDPPDGTTAEPTGAG